MNERSLDDACVCPHPYNIILLCAFLVLATLEVELQSVYFATKPKSLSHTQQVHNEEK